MSVPSKNLLIGVTASVATIKLVPLIDLLLGIESFQFNIQVVSTKNALHFFDPEDLKKRNLKLLLDEDEWSSWKVISDPVLHIELRKWADVFVLAPLDANTLGKMSSGICDNLLTCIARAWDMSKPLFYCPAMNTYMWNHPITTKNIDTLNSFGYVQIPTVSKKLACGDTGDGAMAEISTIVTFVVRHFSSNL